MNSSAGLRSAPRSSPTTLRPALVSSRERIAPVKPMPTTTASVSFNRFAIAASSTEVCDRLRVRDIAPATEGIDLVGIGGGQAGEAQHLPADLVAVAAIDRIGEEAGHGDPMQLRKEGARREILEFGLAFLHRLQRGDAVGGREAIEILAIGLARPGIGGGNAGGEELARRQRELIALLGFAFHEGPRTIHLCAAAPRTAELAVDEDGDTAIAARGRQLVGRDQRVDGC